MDKIRNLYKVNKKAIICILTITIIGILAGSIFYFIISQNDKNTVISSITLFFDNIKNSNLDYKMSLKSNLITNFIYIISIWLLGISLIGMPIILILYFFKSFSLGFSLISIITVYGPKGLIYSFFYLFPHNIINLLSFAILSIYAIVCSFKTTESFVKKKEVNFKPIISKYRYILVMTFLIVILTSLYQTFIMPYILKVILNLVK